jgi:predicted O-methyltransferase YrrM
MDEREGAASKLMESLGADRRMADALMHEGREAAAAADRIAGKNLWALKPEKGIAMYAAARYLVPDLCLETGVGPGVSTTFTLSALERNGKGFLHSIDLGARYGEEDEEHEVGFLVPAGLRKRWELHTGDAAVLLVPLLEKLRDIQFFLHDSAHTYSHVMFELTEVWKHMRRGIIFVDNCTWTDAPQDFARRTGASLLMLSDETGGFCSIRKGL